MKNVNPLCLISVILLFLPIYYHFNSYPALIVTINGIIFHTNINNKAIMNYDILCNLGLILWANYNYPDIIPVSTTVIIIFCIIHALKIYTKTSEIVLNVLHILFVQFPLSVSLRNYYINTN